jgi:hypothetical protein
VSDAVVDVDSLSGVPMGHKFGRGTSDDIFAVLIMGERRFHVQIEVMKIEIQDHAPSLVKNKPGEKQPLNHHVTMQAMFLRKPFNWRRTVYKTGIIRGPFLLVSITLGMALVLRFIVAK